MTITLDVPGELVDLLGDTPQQLSRHLLEALVLDAYREDRLAGAQAAELLGLSRMQWNRFLKQKNVTEHSYSIQDLERDVATIQRLRAEGVLPPA